jgi:hypothetical protein
MSSSGSENSSDMEEKGRGFGWGEFIRYCGNIAKGDSRVHGGQEARLVHLVDN